MNIVQNVNRAIFTPLELFSCNFRKIDYCNHRFLHPKSAGPSLDVLTWVYYITLDRNSAVVNCVKTLILQLGLVCISISKHLKRQV